jgi:hypothetical protein
MASLVNFWRKMLRAAGIGRERSPRWVEPGNAITRAIARGQAFTTMATWEEAQAPFVPAPPAPMEAQVAAAAPTVAPAAEQAAPESAPKRPGVAA